MIQKLNLGLTILLLALVAYLFSRQNSNASEAVPVSKISIPAAKGNGLKIAFVNADTLLSQYDYFKDNKAAYESRAEKAEKQLEDKARKLEQEYMGYQQKAQTMTQDQLKMAEQTLMAKQQELAQQRDKITKQLVEEEERLNRDLRGRVNDYMKKLSETNGFDYVLSFQKGSTMLYGKPMFDITKQVIEDLNKQYKAEKEK